MAASPTSVRLAAPPKGLLGSETPRLWTRPLRPLTPKTSAGFACIAFAEQVLGIALLPWQKWLLIHALELTPEGAYRFRYVLVLVARQNGKTTLMSVKSLWRMFIDGANLVIGTAQNLDVAEEAWSAAVEMAESVPDLKALIEQVVRVNGKKSLNLSTGERYKVTAASRRGGRGLSADDVNLDELREHQHWDAWGAVTKTINARPDPQVWGFSNAGDRHSVVLKHLRGQALGFIETGEGDPALGIFEWSGEDGCALDDWEAIAQANPALGHTIRPDLMAAAAATDPEEIFRTEVLCQWVDDLAEPLFPDWHDLLNAESTIETGLTLGLAVSLDRAFTSIGAAGRNPDGLLHLEPIDRKRGTGWVVRRLVELRGRHGAVTVALDGRGPASTLIGDLEDAGIPVTVMTTNDVTDAWATLYDLVAEGQVAHLGDPELDAAVAGARKRPIGDKWAGGRKTSAVHIDPLEAVVAASWATGLVDSSSPLDSLYF